MGMFDDINVDVKLPCRCKEKSFQTKDFDCQLDTYTITKEGYLLRNNERVHFHGWLNFYTFDENEKWYEFQAKFTDDIFVEVKKAKRSTWRTQKLKKFKELEKV